MNPDKSHEAWEADDFILDHPIKDAPDGKPFRPHFMVLLKHGFNKPIVSAPLAHLAGEADWRGFLAEHLPGRVTLVCDAGIELTRVTQELARGGQIEVRRRAPHSPRFAPSLRQQVETYLKI